jgi:hypothetical protein
MDVPSVRTIVKTIEYVGPAYGQGIALLVAVGKAETAPKKSCKERRDL